MTDYQRTTVTGPVEAFDRLEEEFFVEERTDEEITVITEDYAPPNDPIFEVVQDMDLVDQFSAHGQSIRFQEDLPEKILDEDQYEQEEARVTPANEDWSGEEVTSVLNVLEVIKKKEADHDHISTLEHAQDRLQEMYGDDLKPTTDDVQNVYESCVKTALDLLSAEGVEYRGRQEYKHDNNVLHYALEFVDTEARLENGILPEPRDD